ncbi:MAG: hypothetical protein IBX39_04000 [Candidatus Methanoperedenaceae archaeon]|nr:hypothetical protein [Candidatus Methanoperedenaceae archaeon]MDW7726387.1 hypothetical protein [Candidatus Methanoperedens sp.]
MSQQFKDILIELLSRKQMSISSIARELKKNGYDQHRLILTGYLRALHDMGYLEEIEIPPSKVYIFKDSLKKDIYGIVKEHLKNFDESEKTEIAIYLLTSLFHRPCFKYEIELLGIEPRKTKNIKESKDPRLKEHREAVTRIKIPPDDPAFEIKEIPTNTRRENELLVDIITDIIDLEGLKAKYQQTKLA